MYAVDKDTRFYVKTEHVAYPLFCHVQENEVVLTGWSTELTSYLMTKDNLNQRIAEGERNNILGLAKLLNGSDDVKEVHKYYRRDDLPQKGAWYGNSASPLSKHEYEKVLDSRVIQPLIEKNLSHINNQYIPLNEVKTKEDTGYNLTAIKEYYRTYPEELNK